MLRFFSRVQKPRNMTYNQFLGVENIYFITFQIHLKFSDFSFENGTPIEFWSLYRFLHFIQTFLINKYELTTVFVLFV